MTWWSRARGSSWSAIRAIAFPRRRALPRVHRCPRGLVPRALGVPSPGRREEAVFGALVGGIAIVNYLLAGCGACSRRDRPGRWQNGRLPRGQTRRTASPTGPS